MRNASRIGRSWRQICLAGVGLAALSAAATNAAQAAPIYAFQQTIQIPGVASFTGYDLSTFDQSNQQYYLTDRSNNGIDVFSAATNAYVTQIGTGLFAGTQGGNNSISGPNGVSLSNFGSGKLLIAGNGPSNLISFNLDSTGTTAVGAPRTISTAVTGTPTPRNRVDGVAFAPTANTILAANNASNPGFLTLINNATGAVTRSITLDGTGGYPNVAGNGVEATIFNTARGTFFVAVPSLNTGTNAGGVIELDAATGNLLHTYDFNGLGVSGACSPTGLVQGAGATMFVACSDPTAGHSILLDPANAGSLTVVPGISGGDQVSYDSKLNLFYEAARFQPGGPVLGVIDPTTLSVQTLSIGSNDHAVAVDPISGEVFVATGSTNAFTDCAGGCIGVFAPQAAVPEPASIAILSMSLLGLGVMARRRHGAAGRRQGIVD